MIRRQLRLSSWVTFPAVVPPLVAAWLLTFGLAGHAAPILDQHQDAALNANAAFGFEGLERAQTFTVGTPGILDSIDIRVARNGSFTDTPLAVTFYDTHGGAPDETGLFNVNVASSLLPVGVQDPDTGLIANFDWIKVDLRSFNFLVSQGDVLAFGFGIPASASERYFYIDGGCCSSTDPYSGGSAFVRSVKPSSTFFTHWPVWTVNVSNSDWAFRTYVEPVPLPAAFWMLSSAFSFLFWTRRQLMGHS